MAMMTLKVIAALLDYPTKATLADLPAMREALAAEGRLSPGLALALDGFIDALAADDLMDRQAAWVDQFDRTRSLSLNLFEHVHGESRDRGQAMVDLQDLYRRHGVDVGVAELPDYLPVFLEFLSLLPEAEALELLGEAGRVVAALTERLQGRASPYAPLMAAVAELAGAAGGAGAIATPPTDGDLDTAWAEEPVGFGAGAALAGCGRAAACG